MRSIIEFIFIALQSVSACVVCETTFNLFSHLSGQIHCFLPICAIHKYKGKGSHLLAPPGTEKEECFLCP